MKKAKTSLAPAHLRFAVIASDVVLFTIRDNELLVRLVSVHRPPHFPNSAAFTGGLIHPKETAEEAAKRLLEEKAGVSSKKIYLEQLYTFSEVSRDPRGRVVAVAYSGFIPWDALSTAEQGDSQDAWWARVQDAKSLAYDHDEMLDIALKRLRSRVTYTTLMSKLMPEEFTLTELESAYESILHADLDKRNFRKKIHKLKIVTELPRKRTGGRFRPAQLYKFTSPKVHEIEVL